MIYGLILLCSETILWMPSVLRNSLRLALQPRNKSVFVNGTHTLEIICILQSLDAVLSKYIWVVNLTVHVFYIFGDICLFLSDPERVISKFPSLVVGLSISPFNFVNYCSISSNTILLGPCTLKIVFLVHSAFYHYAVSLICNSPLCDVDIDRSAPFFQLSYLSFHFILKLSFFYYRCVSYRS